MRGGEEAEAHGKHVHIYEGDLGPGVEGWGESNACATIDMLESHLDIVGYEEMKDT